jgi:hypothetical protein
VYQSKTKQRMATLTQSTFYVAPATSSLLNRYRQFTANAEFNRLGWAATALTIQGCILSPVHILLMSTYGGGDWQFLVSMLCFLLVLVPILAAQPVKYIFPAFSISLLVHLSMVLLNLL